MNERDYLNVIKSSIYLIRGEKVILDETLAEMYGVETKILNQSVKRNKDKFPDDFMFRLTKDEYEVMRSQIVTTSYRPNTYLPYAFTEHGVAMLSSVLRSKKATEVNIAIIRTFIKLRKLVLTNELLAEKIRILEDQYSIQSKDIQSIYKLIERLSDKDENNDRGLIGFKI